MAHLANSLNLGWELEYELDWHFRRSRAFLECITILKSRISQKQDELFPVEEAIKTIHSMAMS